MPWDHHIFRLPQYVPYVQEACWCILRRARKCWFVVIIVWCDFLCFAACRSLLHGCSWLFEHLAASVMVSRVDALFLKKSVTTNPAALFARSIHSHFKSIFTLVLLQYWMSNVLPGPTCGLTTNISTSADRLVHRRPHEWKMSPPLTRFPSHHLWGNEQFYITSQCGLEFILCCINWATLSDLTRLHGCQEIEIPFLALSHTSTVSATLRLHVIQLFLGCLCLKTGRFRWQRDNIMEFLAEVRE